MPMRLHGFLQPEMVGEDTTERTTVSLTTVDLSTITTPRVAVSRWIVVRCAYRKSAGAANSASLGLKVNATAVIANVAVTSGTNQIEEGVAEFVVPPQETGYLEAATLIAVASSTAGSTAQYLSGGSTPAPAAAVTSIVVTGQVADAAVTLAIKNVQVFVL